MKSDIGLETLLELNGTEYTEKNGCWYRIEAWEVEQTSGIPHGIRYNLTLHDNFNQRILGFDNAHAIYINEGGRFNGYIIKYDHMHTSIKGPAAPYEFMNAQQLLEDFFKEVNSILNKLNTGGN